ncbi:MAG: nucleotidyltransferase family protein [Acidobacteriaceae bacterium]
MRQTAAHVGAVVLAAGRSARMGEAKQLMRVGESGMLERTLGNVRAGNMDEVILVLGFSAESIRRALPAALLEGVRIVANEKYESGMASSLRAGLAAVSPAMDAALIVLADQPFVRPETMNLLVERYRESDAAIVVPFYRGLRGNPVLLDRSVFAEAMALEGDVGCRAIFARHADGMLEVDVEDAGILADIDSREDYERLFPHSSEGA